MDETTTFIVEVTNVSDGFTARTAQAFAVPVDGTDPAPAFPGEAYEATFTAAPGERVSFVTMFVQSNDWFFAFAPEGLELFDDGAPITGDITDAAAVWDAGTEIDQEPGTGADQAPRQAGPDTGAVDPDATVRMVSDIDTAEYITVMLSNDGNEFTLSIENNSEAAMTPTPFAPGVAVVHGAGTPLFAEGTADPGYGLEALAEDGDPTDIVEWLANASGVTTPFAHGGRVGFHRGSPF